jgi:CubicO group peptidase (beta-lactamase class C family)
VVGASIAVVRGSDTIAVKGYGKANLELGVATPPAAIYEIGSVTKQFTGAAIMQLVEQGKLSLDDDIGRYVPQFNTKGRRIPIRRLLDHTSGIRGYTEIPEARSFLPLALAPDTLLRTIERWPYDFEPGEEQIYNNSAFFLAGLVIEKVSGMTYAQYVEQKLMAPAGMTSSHYCSDVAIRPNKTTGYDWGATGPVQKRPLSHVWPYAAGSLCANARDMVAWNEALHRTRRILGAESYRAMITADTLNDGTRVGYAKGLALTPVLGHRSLHHGGGINGWTSENLYFPEESLSVVVLYNVSGPSGPAETAEAIAKAVLGERPVVAAPVRGPVSRYVGTYTGRGRGGEMSLAIEADGGALVANVRGARRPLVHVGDGVFVTGSIRAIFGETNGRVETLRLDMGSANNVLRRK